MLGSYYASREELLLVPIEELTPEGMTAVHADRLRGGGRVPKGWIELFNRSFSLYWERAVELSRVAPQYWFPPRLQHVCVAMARIRPYFQPLNRTSWLVEIEDFDPARSNEEFGAHQIFHAERMGLLKEVVGTIVHNLSYWLVRTPEEIDRFGQACRRVQRSDAGAYRALADALDWIPRCYHESLRPPRLVTAEKPLPVPRTGLLLPRAYESDYRTLLRAWTEHPKKLMEAYYRRYHGADRRAVHALISWLREDAPRVLVTARDGEIVWDPEAGRTAEFEREVEACGGEVVRSLQEDLGTIDRQSRRFLASLLSPEDLPAPDPRAEQSGLSYIHVDRGLVAYNLDEKGMERRRVPAPPFERFMLGARTIHEWGHRAVDAGWVPLRAGAESRVSELRGELGELFERAVRDAPAPIRAHTADDLKKLGGSGPGEALAGIPMERLPDFQANLLAQRYLSLAERETYIRNNVYSLSLSYPSTALFRRLARYTFEFQYLRFSAVADPVAYFRMSTWFDDEYLKTGILSTELADALFTTVGSILDGYAVDETRFTAPGP